MTGGTALNELAELPLLCACLRALVRPDDPIALVAVLRSELFGVSDSALYQFKRAGGRFSFRQPIPPSGLSPEHAEAIGDALRRLDRYLGWLDSLPAVTAIERIADDLGLPARACAAPGGDVRAGSLAKVIELCRCVQHEHLSIVDMVEYLERLVTADEKYDGISVRPPAAPVVRLMNLHKVKGLEAPVVFLADPTGNYEHPIEPAHRSLRRPGSRLHGGLCTTTGNRFLATAFDRLPHRVGAIRGSRARLSGSRERAVALRRRHPVRHMPRRQRHGISGPAKTRGARSPKTSRLPACTKTPARSPRRRVRRSA